MFLTKLELRGFKSFVDETTVSFGNGITAVVGPNGCGKTNISDAIRWVMGEQSAKQLRGEAMDDVIFNGSARRKPIGMAEVVLTMMNDKGILPTQYSEVEIGRRVPGLVEIRSGLAAGDRVVIDGATLIPPGGVVRVLREEAPPKA